MNNTDIIKTMNPECDTLGSLKAIKSEVVCFVLFTEKDTEKFVNEAFLLWWYII